MFAAATRPPRRRAKKATTKPARPARRKVTPCVSVIIPACNEAATLRDILVRLKSWLLVKEIIVVANGCNDGTEEIALQLGARVITFSGALGPDVGRAIGAQHATGNYLLFLDADIDWRLKELRPFIFALRAGADIALNAYPARASIYYHHPTAVAKRALNIILDHANLGAASLTAVPHAMKAACIDKIGYEYLAIPPVALARATLAGLKVVVPHYVDVRSKNRWSREYPGFKMKDLIIGDHLEAVSFVIAARGERGGFKDSIRDYSALKHIKVKSKRGMNISAVIPACNEVKTLPSVVRHVKRADIDDVLVVDNGSKDGTSTAALASGATVHQFNHSLGHDIGRAIGAKIAKRAKCAVFVDADFTVHATDLKPFVDAIIKEEADIALNDLSDGLHLKQKRDPVSTMKWFLNIALQREDLGIASVTAVPHAVSNKALRVIPYTDFAVPPKAHARAILENLKISTPHFVDVVKANRYRVQSHSSVLGAPLSRLIIGDHIEALALLLTLKGARGGYTQPRDLTVLKPSDSTTLQLG